MQQCGFGGKVNWFCWGIPEVINLIVQTIFNILIICILIKDTV